MCTQALGFSREVVLNSLEHGVRNKAVVTYWLLADALLRQRQAGSFSRTTISPASVVNLVRAQGGFLCNRVLMVGGVVHNGTGWVV